MPVRAARVGLVFANPNLAADRVKVLVDAMGNDAFRHVIPMHLPGAARPELARAG
jgi:hypothetical protein